MPLFTILFRLLLIRIKEMPTCKSCFNKFTNLGKVEHKSFVPYNLYIFSILWILQLDTHQHSQIIINFHNNTWYPKISLNPMMCMAMTRLYGVHDNLRYDEGATNILATVMFNSSSHSSLRFFLLVEFHIY